MESSPAMAAAHCTQPAEAPRLLLANASAQSPNPKHRARFACSIINYSYCLLDEQMMGVKNEYSTVVSRSHRL